MNVKAVAKNYGCLTPEERFRLILAASGRDDAAERDRLVRAGQWIKLSMPDHAPYARAFDELALLTYLELLEAAACYLDALDRTGDTCDGISDEEQQAEEDHCEVDSTEAREEADAKDEADARTDNARNRPPWQRSLDLALAAGFVLRTKADGWQQFCERLHVPPCLLWQDLPGFDRLQRALALAEKAAFAPEGMRCWLNAIRPAGAAELAEVPLTVEAVADATDEAFRERVRWWGG
jgi:hypothetical protein